MTDYRLLTMREGRLHRRPEPLQATSEAEAMAEAAALVDQREEAGSWPEGCDAVLAGPPAAEGEPSRHWTYTDGWEEWSDG